MVLQRGSDTTDHFLGKGHYYMFVLFVPFCSCRCVTDGCWVSLSPDRCTSPLCVPTLGVEVGVRHVVLRNRQCALTPSLHLVTLSARGGWRKGNSSAQSLAPCKLVQELCVRRRREGAGS